MDNDMRDHVVNLLESSQERKRKIALLHYELEHSPHTTEDEIISAMALGHGDGRNGGVLDGRISDKTFYIALNYQSRANKLNADTKKEIVLQLVKLEREQERLEYYTALLEQRQALVIRLTYFEGLPWDEVAKRAADKLLHLFLQVPKPPLRRFRRKGNFGTSIASMRGYF